MRNWICFGALILGVGFATPLTMPPTISADEAKPAAATDPDFQVQGEYVGDVELAGGKQKLGVQVIALGKGKFHAVRRAKGLPSDGWDHKDGPTYEGATADGVTQFQMGDLVGTVKGETMTVMAGANEVGQLEHVIRKSPTLGAKPPNGAVVLFDGKSVEHFDNARVTSEGLLMQGPTTKFKHQSGTLHIEFQIPYAPLVPSRGNSGVYLQSRYEVQILNSMGLKPHNHECGGIPSIKDPDLNMTFPPLSWQTFDVDFTAAQFTDGKKTTNARMTVKHNGVLIHDNVELTHATTSSPLSEGPEPGPINLQDHQAEVRYRNIWFVEK
jgi:hypothetical protein